MIHSSQTIKAGFCLGFCDFSFSSTKFYCFFLYLLNKRILLQCILFQRAQGLYVTRTIDFYFFCLFTAGEN